MLHIAPRARVALSSHSVDIFKLGGTIVQDVMASATQVLGAQVIDLTRGKVILLVAQPGREFIWDSRFLPASRLGS